MDHTDIIIAICKWFQTEDSRVNEESMFIFWMLKFGVKCGAALEVWLITSKLKQPVALCCWIYSMGSGSAYGFIMSAVMMICQLTIYLTIAWFPSCIAHITVVKLLHISHPLYYLHVKNIITNNLLRWMKLRINLRFF